MTRQSALLAVLFAIALALQGGILVQTRIAPTLRDLASVRNASALDRSATLAFGDDIAAYMAFVRGAVPPDAQLVVPPMIDEPVLGNIGLMQYFLLPRHIINCPAGPDLRACVRSMDGPTTYTLRTADFPNPNDVPPDRPLLAFSPEQGVYAPPPRPVDEPSSAARAAPVSLRPSPLFVGQPTVQLATGILLLATLGALGGLLTAILDPRRPPWRLAGTFFPLGIGLTTWIAFVLSRIGMPLDWRTALLTLGILLVGGLVALRRRRRLLPPDAEGDHAHLISPGHRPVEWMLVSLLLATIVLQISISLGQSYSEWDAMAIWSVKGYGIALEGNVLAAADWGAHGLTYPLNIPLGIAMMRMVQGDTEPISKLIFPLFYASLITGCIQFWLRRGLTLRLATAGGLLIASVPLVFVYGANGYANLPFATYLVLGALCLVEGIVDRRSSLVMTGGLLLGCASWTRVEGLVYAAGILGLGIITGLALRRSLRPLLAAALLAIVLYAPWAATSAQATSTGEVGQAVTTGLRSLQDRMLPWAELLVLARVTAKHMLTPTTWGFLLPSVVLLLVWSGFRRQGAWDLTLALVVASAAVTAAATAGILLVRSLTLAGASFSGMLDRSLDRHLLPALILLTLAAVLAVGIADGSGVASTHRDPIT